MLLGLAVVLLILWALGAFVWTSVGGIIHILLVLALISVVWHFVMGNRTRV